MNTPSGVFIEQLETDPARFLPDQTHTGLGDEDAVGASSTGQGAVVSIDLNRPMAQILEELSKHPVKTRLSLTGPLVVGQPGQATFTVTNDGTTSVLKHDVLLDALGDPSLLR